MVESAALVNFKSQLKMADALLDLERGYRNPPKVADQATVGALRGGAAVLMVAAFESFLREAIEEHLGVLTAQPLKIAFHKLPPPMQVATVYNSLESAMKGPRYGQPGGKAQRLPEIQQACTDIVNGLISPSAFSSSGGNPDADCVKDLLAQLQITDVFGRIAIRFERAWRRKEFQGFIRAKLDEIVRRRHVIAHTAKKTLEVSRSDLRTSIRFLTVLATVLDKELRDHVHQIIKSA